MEWLTEPFELGLQQRALIGGSLAAIALAVVGTWVVIRGLTFFGDALVHGVVPGIALAVLLDFNLMAAKFSEWLDHTLWAMLEEEYHAERDRWVENGWATARS